MGTTLVAAVCAGPQATIFNVGDSRAYRINESGICAVTRDHSVVQDMLENGASINGEQLYDIADPRGEFESTVLTEQSMKQFKDKLTEQDRKILQLRYEGYALKEIAEKTGFKSPSAVSKRIEKLAGAYEDFVSGEYSDFLDKHTT